MLIKQQMINLDLKYIKRTRELFIELVESLSIEELNKIPEGFNNNIIWNFGHIIVSTHGLCYLRSAVMPDIKIPFVEKYRKGSKPESFISKEEMGALKMQAVSSLENIEKDYDTGVFKNITPYSTATYSYEMNSIEEIVACCVAHESLHYGYALALKRAIK